MKYDVKVLYMAFLDSLRSIFKEALQNEKSFM